MNDELKRIDKRIKALDRLLRRAENRRQQLVDAKATETLKQYDLAIGDELHTTHEKLRQFRKQWGATRYTVVGTMAQCIDLHCIDGYGHVAVEPDELWQIFEKHNA